MAKILVVDDDTALLRTVRRALESAAYEVIEATDGKSGVQLACAQVPDLILCDVRMEELDGYGALAALRQNSVTASLPFILMTGQADAAGMRLGMELGADDYLPKPFSVEQLLGAVEARLRKQQTMREQAARQLSVLRSNISLALPHEFLTPLNGVLGFADLLVADAASLRPEEVASMANAIRDSARRLERLTRNFLLLAHLEIHADDRSPRERTVGRGSLGPGVEEVVRNLAAKANRTLDVTLDLCEVEGFIRADHWSKIIEEIVDNALKFSVSGTPVLVQLVRHNDSVVLRVTDRGRGMRPEHVAEVGAYMQFERKFYEQQGSGLGLTLARRLAELQGGRLAITSQVGVGTVVEVALPRAGESLASPML
jgi:two-component system, sensor histidine kinase and response regulator